MSVGGQSGNQSSRQNSQFDNETTGAFDNTSASSSASSSRAVAPGGWEEAWRNILNTGGQTAGQTAALNFLSGPDANSLLNPERNQWYGAIERNDKLNAFTSPDSFRSLYGTPGAINVPTVGTPTAASQMGAYMSPYTNEVIQAAEGDLWRNFQRTGAQSDLDAAAAGAFGGSRHGVRDSLNAENFLRNVATTSAGLRDAGFSRAMEGGKFDASQALMASGQNAANSIGAQQFTQQLGTQRDMFGAQNAQQAIQNQMGNTATAANIGLNAANSAAGVGGMTFDQMLRSLMAGTPLFGQDVTGQSSGNASGTTSGTSSGTASGTSSGGSSSKGGGLKLF